MLGEVVLTLMVLTSDEVEFKTGLSEPLENEEQQRIEAFYNGMREPLAAEPPLTFAFLPGIPRAFTGDKMLETLDRMAAGTRFFGSRAIDMDHTPQAPATIYNGGAHPDRLCLMMLAGDVKPRFFTNSIIKQDIFYHKARITGAEGNRLITLDNMPAEKYMEKIGVLENGQIDAIAAFPILANPQDGTEPQLLVFTGVDPDGAMICVSKVIAGGILSIGTPTTAIVLDNAADIINQIKQEQERNGLLIFSCISRNMALSDPLSEMKTVRELLRGSSAPFLFAYSGGEICPRYKADNELVNGFHMYAIIACIF
jgi:hypothetical protein